MRCGGTPETRTGTGQQQHGVPWTTDVGRNFHGIKSYWSGKQQTGSTQITLHIETKQYMSACSSELRTRKSGHMQAVPTEKPGRKTLLLLECVRSSFVLIPLPIKNPSCGQVIRLLLCHGWRKELEQWCVFCYFFGTTTTAFWAASARSAKEKPFTEFFSWHQQ
jgi:hypothetical protein